MIEVVCPIVCSSPCCCTKWNQKFVRQRVSIVTNKEVLIREVIQPLLQLFTSVEDPGIIGPAWTSNTKVNESQVRITHSLDVQTKPLVMATEIVTRVSNGRLFNG